MAAELTLGLWAGNQSNDRKPLSTRSSKEHVYVCACGQGEHECVCSPKTKHKGAEA